MPPSVYTVSSIKQLQAARDVRHQRPGGKLAQVEERFTPRRDGQHHHENPDQIHSKTRLHLKHMETM